jgi:hypothetical protein
VDWVEQGDCTPERPTFAAPAQLRARGFGNGSQQTWQVCGFFTGWLPANFDQSASGSAGMVRKTHVMSLDHGFGLFCFRFSSDWQRKVLFSQIVVT